ncbi:MAG: ATP-binding protein, partial [Myxococcales bacterium]|nr:ATP-binding protein [Myxococcales bacterium]
YRERALQGTGVAPRFPLWGQPTAALAREMIDAGARAIVCCLDPRACPASLLGARFDHALLDALPPGVDPCAERGEFHTFATDGPAFRHPLAVRRGPAVIRDGFHFLDLELADVALTA